MQPSPRTTTRRTLTRSAVSCAALAAALALAGCTSGSGHGSDTGFGGHPAASGPSSKGAAPTGSTSAAATAPASHTASTPAVITLVGHKAVNPATPVTVSISGGHLDAVTMKNAAGTKVTGALNAAHTVWTTTEDLGYAKTYKIDARGENADGVPTTRTETLSTLAPDNRTKAYFQRIGGYGLTDGATYGVGIVPIVHFDEKVDHAAALKALKVTTTPHVDGAWYWDENGDAHYRPQHYWATGTKVTISANIYGAKLGSGLFGQADASTSFTIGAKQIAIATDNAPKAVNKVKVYRNGVLVRTMNTSMGMHSGTTSGGKYIDFHTMNGTYTVLEHDNPAIMSSASYGLAAGDPGGYAPEAIYHATKISTDGIYLHYLSTEYDQDNGIDVSHGCLNLNMSNSIWYYNHSVIGDPVEISGTHGPTIQVWQGGDWSVPWSKWKAGSPA